MMSDIAKIPAPILDALYSHYKEELLLISDELVTVGLGAASGEEINKLAANGDPLAIRYVEAQNAFLEVAYERTVRLQQHGSTKPVRSKTAEVYSAVRRSPREKSDVTLPDNASQGLLLDKRSKRVRAVPLPRITGAVLDGC